ncbi:hypothetical protein BSKO_12025 [Bryopsis sp. KO-2023]|nr:hypothetical protein BSKO_12025 [Bryopsis sp. KO-2023]
MFAANCVAHVASGRVIACHSDRSSAAASGLKPTSVSQFTGARVGLLRNHFLEGIPHKRCASRSDDGAIGDLQTEDPVTDAGSYHVVDDFKVNSRRGDQGASTSSASDSDLLGAVLASSDFQRRFSKCKDAAEALQLVSDEAASLLTRMPNSKPRFTQAHARSLISACLEREKMDLALSVFRSMSRTIGAGRVSRSGIRAWPVADIETVQEVVLGLCRDLRVADAMCVMEGIQRQGLPKSDEVPFGHVVDCPLAPEAPLTVVRPEEGAKLVNCSVTRYRFEVFSGRVTRVTSEALNKSDNFFVAAARMAGLWKDPTIQAIHEMLVVSPDGVGRTFRFATESAEVPAQEGARITVVCAPSQSDLGGLLGAGPPGKKPGEPLSISNQVTNSVTKLWRAPLSGASTGIPGWALPTAVILAGSDAASWFVDPALPALIGVGAVSLVGAAVAGNELVIPRLKQLPKNSVNAERVRQELLGQHKDLVRKIVDLLKDSAEDVRTLAKLWQLESKMASVGTAGRYDARIERIELGRENLEARIRGKVELLDGFSRVAKMIEIEVEMDVEVAYAEINGISKQLEKLAEVELLQEQMVYQAEAQDEVERLLKAAN